MKYVMYTLVQIKKGQHAFACHKTFKFLKKKSKSEKVCMQLSYDSIDVKNNNYIILIYQVKLKF